jgi:multidrug transporter EmrE-like cation transporter
MRSVAWTTAKLIAAVLALSFLGEAIMRLTLHVRLAWFFYATLSGFGLGGVPSAPVLVSDRRASVRSRLTLSACLLGLVLMNCWLVALLNGSDLGWSKGDYTLAIPVFAYAISCMAGFYALRPRSVSAR